MFPVFFKKEVEVETEPKVHVTGKKMTGERELVIQLTEFITAVKLEATFETS
jgi:hypothetical protein